MAQSLKDQIATNKFSKSAYRTAQVELENLNVQKAKSVVHAHKIRLQNAQREQMDKIKKEWAKQKNEKKLKVQTEHYDDQFKVNKYNVQPEGKLNIEK